MATTLATIKTKLNNIADETIDSTKASYWINDAYKDVASRMDWSWLQTKSTFNTIAGQFNYTLAADLRKLLDLRSPDYRVTKQSHQWLSANYPEYPEYTNAGSVQTAKPQNYVEFGSELWLYPIPNDAYTFSYKYIKDITELSEAGDEPIIPERFREVLVLGAYYRWLLSDEADSDMITNAKRDYETLVQKMISEEQSDGDFSPVIPWGRPII